MLGWSPAESCTLWQRGKKRYMYSTKAEMDSLWIGWHKHCFTSKVGGNFTVILIFKLPILVCPCESASVIMEVYVCMCVLACNELCIMHVHNALDHQ